MVADYEKTRKKKDPELDRSTIKVRLPDDVLVRLVRLSMKSAACRNKGFILDGYPRNQSDVKNVFLEKIEDYEPSELNEGDILPGFKIQEEIIPQYVIVFQGEDVALKQRVKELPIEKTADTHYTDPHMDRRLKIYREQNVNDSGNSVQCLFKKILDPDNIKLVNSAEPEDKNMSEL
jgi:adenylate kinase